MAFSYDETDYLDELEDIDITQVNKITVCVDDELELELTVEQAMILKDALNEIFSKLTCSDVSTSVN